MRTAVLLFCVLLFATSCAARSNKINGDDDLYDDLVKLIKHNYDCFAQKNLTCIQMLNTPDCVWRSYDLPYLGTTGTNDLHPINTAIN